MNFKKSMSLLTLVAVSASMAACGTQSNTLPSDSLTQTQDVSAMAAASDKYSKYDNGEVIPGEFIVKLKPGAKANNAFKNGEEVKAIGGSETGMLLVKSEMGTMNMSANTNVLWSEPNRVMKLPKEAASKPSTGKDTTALGPKDALFAQQWAHVASDSVEGWSVAKANKKGDVTIAIIDTGIDGKHPDLKEKLLPGYDAYGQGKEYVDMQGHGTHCAGIAAAFHNDIGVAGYAPDAKLIAVKVLGDNGSGSYAAVADGIAWAAKSKADVMSMSLGGPSSSQAIADAIALAVKNGKLVVAAMGNSGKNASVISYPAADKGVFAVGANDIKDKTASFSQVGKHCAISAPGVNIMSTFPTYASGMPAVNYGSISGTSMACPGVSGLAALVKSVNPSLKADQIKDIITKSSVDLGPKGWDQDYGAGKINTLAAVKLAVSSRK